MQKYIKDNYLCIKHDSTSGFKDDDGDFHCWLCYKEDKFINPEGEIVNTYSNLDYMARMLSIGSHRTDIEVWRLTDKKRIYSNTHENMFRASREWIKIIESIDEGQIQSYGR